MLKKILFSIHIISLFIVGLHLLSSYCFNFGLAQNLLLYIKLGAITSGFFIAILFFKQLNRKRFYFGMYPLGMAIFIFGYFFRGILGGLLMSMILFPVVPDEVAFQQESTTIYTKYTGFFSLCCTYGIYENIYTVFEKKYGEFMVEGQSELKVKHLENASKVLKLTYKDYVYDDLVKDMILNDTTIVYKK